MNTTYPNQKPGLLTAVAIMTLTSGIINLFWGFVSSATALSTFVGVVCLPITILPTILGVFEIIYAAKLLSSQPQPVQPSQAIAISEIAMILGFNVFSMVVGILTLIFYNDLSVKEYFAKINGIQISTPIVEPPQPTPAPMLETPSVPEAPVLPEPEVQEEPVKPKRTRKVSGK
jgi:hypothetical protein